MQMIRHQHIVAHQPLVSSHPNFAQQLMRLGTGEPPLSILCADGQKNKRGPADINVNAGSRAFAAGLDHR
jgi:hypothetical protein